MSDQNKSIFVAAVTSSKERPDLTGTRSSHEETSAQYTADGADESVTMDSSAKKERSLNAKIDFRVIPYMTVLYLLAFLDRTNISGAAIIGLKQDLDLTGNRFNVALVIFFVPYCIFEIPSNLVLKRVKPHIWLSVLMGLFGLATLCTGFVTNYSGLLATRFFLGLFESAMFPGCLYLLSMWYTRYEAQRRYSFFFSSTTLAGAFGGLIATGCSKITLPILNSAGAPYYGAWRWVFIIEGAITILLAFVFFFLLPDFPEDAKWLSKSERATVIDRLQVDQGKPGLEMPITLREVINVMCDYTTYLGGFMYFFGIIPAYSYAYFAPTIIKSYGYGTVHTQLLSVAPWSAAFVYSLVLATFSDKTKHRFGFGAFSYLLAIVGFSIVFSITGVEHRGVEYAGLFLIVMGVYGGVPILVCWYQVNCRGHRRRPTAIGWQIGFGNLGGVVAPFLFLASDAPLYRVGFAVNIGSLCLGILTCLLYELSVIYQNRKIDRLDNASIVDDKMDEDDKKYRLAM